MSKTAVEESGSAQGGVGRCEGTRTCQQRHWGEWGAPTACTNPALLAQGTTGHYRAATPPWPASGSAMRGGRTLRAVPTGASTGYPRRGGVAPCDRGVPLRTRSIGYRRAALDPRIMSRHASACAHVATTPLGLGFCTRCLGPLRTHASTDTPWRIPSTTGLGHRAHHSLCPQQDCLVRCSHAWSPGSGAQCGQRSRHPAGSRPHAAEGSTKVPR